MDILRRKVSAVPNMNSIDLKELVPAPTRTFNIFLIREQALHTLQQRLRAKEQEMEYCTFLIETCLYLIWSHLDYYMLRAVPGGGRRYGGSGTGAGTSGACSPPADATWRIMADDISQLKQGLVSIFNDIFSRKLIETTQVRP